MKKIELKKTDCYISTQYCKLLKTVKDTEVLKPENIAKYLLR